MIKLNDIYFSYDTSTPVLTDFNLTVSPGEIIAIQGKSGSGKSTILRLIAGLEKIQLGNIYLDDKLINTAPVNKRSVGYVFQNNALFPHLTIQKNIEYGLFNLTRQVRKKAVLDVAKKVDILELLQRYPHEISGGQKQRVAIARTLVTQPKVLLLDEPFSALDTELKATIQSDIKQLLDDLKITTILVTHDIKDAMALNARIVHLDT
ncbi:MAG: ABC transporter ATP-binding protein [Candidatus Izimaplasma sp.]|nr:ABC transporter ATP-binding protein [Candidatus Izimaplasma bacterium]